MTADADAFGQIKDIWAEQTGHMTVGQAGEAHARAQSTLDAGKAQAAAAAEQARQAMEQGKEQARQAAQRTQEQNQADYEALQHQQEQSANEREQWWKDHPTQGPTSAQDASDQLSGLADHKLDIYRDYIDPNDKTWGKTNGQLAQDEVQIDPTAGLSDLSEDDLQKSAGDYDPYKGLTSDSGDSGDSASSGSGLPAGVTAASTVILDLELVSNLANRTAQINEAFQKSTAKDQEAAFDTVGNKCRGYTGKPESAVHTFYTNWKIRRGKIRETAEQYGKNARIVHQNFTRLDTEIAAKSMRQEAVLLESKRRALSKAAGENSDGDSFQIAPPTLEGPDADVHFIGQENGVYLDGGTIGAGLGLQAESAWAPYAAAAASQMTADDHIPDQQYTTVAAGRVEHEWEAQATRAVDGVPVAALAAVTSAVGVVAGAGLASLALRAANVLRDQPITGRGRVVVASPPVGANTAQSAGRADGGRENG